MKSIVFMIINMNVGGTEKALLNMINELNKEKFAITVLMLEEYGGFLDYIPKHVRIEYLQEYKNIKDLLNKPLHIIAFDYLKTGKLIDAIIMIFIYLLTKINNNASVLFKYLLKDVNYPKNEYDIAVAYAGPMDFISYFIAYKIKAKMKIQWIHFDITKIGFNSGFASKVYPHFDKVFTVSQEGRSKLAKAIPFMENKIATFRNVLSAESLTEMADKGKGFEDSFNGHRILTVGRLSKEKGQDLAMKVLVRLSKAGYNVRWYCIGDGNSRKDYELLIKKYGVEEDFILLGTNPNPYPYMKQCDLYVQPSRHEGYCITLAEAKYFNRPIVTTNFTGAKEQIVHGRTGIIVEFNESQMYEAVKQIIDDKILRREIQDNLQMEIRLPSEDIEKIFVC